MEKTRINLDVLLPEVPNERDECVTRIIGALQNVRGIEKIHVVPGDRDSGARICFHYDPRVISITKVEDLARRAGAELTGHYGHLVIETKGVRHTRHARTIESDIQSHKG